MPKKISEPWRKKAGTAKVSKNLWVNSTVTARGLAVLREMGYEASEGFEKIMEKLWEERMKMGRLRRGDHLQINLFDNVTPPDPKEFPPEAKKK